jgi:hypothetical protein
VAVVEGLGDERAPLAGDVGDDDVLGRDLPPDMAFIAMSPSGWPSPPAMIRWPARRSASMPNLARKDGESTLSHTGTLPALF